MFGNVTALVGLHVTGRYWTEAYLERAVEVAALGARRVERLIGPLLSGFRVGG